MTPCNNYHPASEWDTGCLCGFHKSDHQLAAAPVGENAPQGTGNAGIATSTPLRSLAEIQSTWTTEAAKILARYHDDPVRSFEGVVTLGLRLMLEANLSGVHEGNWAQLRERFSRQHGR